MARAVEYGFNAKGSPAPRNAAVTEPAAEGGGSGCVASSSGASGNEIVRIAQSQLGRSESPIGSNCNPYGPCVEWCSLFVAWVWERAGVPLKGGTAPYAYSGTIYEWAKDHEEEPFPAPRHPAIHRSSRPSRTVPGCCRRRRRRHPATRSSTAAGRPKATTSASSSASSPTGR